MSRGRWAALGLGAAVTVASAVPLDAQATPGPAFSWARVEVGAATIVPRLPDGDFWRAGTGWALRVETPLRPGVLALGAQGHSARAGADVTGVERSRWLFLYLGWGAERRLGPLRVGAEARLGTLVDAASDDVLNAVEREVLTGGAAWLAAELGPRWSVRATGSLARVHARHPWTPTSATLGVARTLGLGPVGRALADAGVEPPRARAEGMVEVAELPAGGGGRPPWWRPLGDVPSDAFGLDGVGTDRVDRRWSPGALRSPEAGSPRVWLDGLPLPDDPLGGPIWPWLPLSTADLARIVALDRPGLLAGRPEAEGALRVETGPLEGGRHVRLRGLTLNERGDPGALRFTPLSSPNVDGPLYEGDVTGGHAWGSGWVTATGARRERWSVTRPELRGRSSAFFRGASSRTRVDGVGVGLVQAVAAGSLRVRTWLSEGERYLRAPGIGTELSADVRHAGGGVSAVRPLGPANTLRAYGVVVRTESTSPNREDAPADPRSLAWEASSAEAGVQLELVRAASTLTVGLDGARHDDRARGAGSAVGAHGTGTRRMGAWRLEAGGAVGSDRYGLTALVAVTRDLTDDVWLRGAASVRAGGRAGGYELGGLDDVDRTLFRTPAVVTVGETPGVEPGRRTTLELEGGIDGGGWRRGMRLFIHDFGPEQRPRLGYALDGGVVLATWGPPEVGSGRVRGWTAEAAGPLGEHVRARIEGQWIGAEGSAPFEAWWSGAPRWRASSSAAITLRGGWTLEARAHARTSVRWTGFDGVPPIGGVPGRGRIPGSVTADLHLVGAVLGGRARLAAGLTNIFDHDVRRHPLGAGEARGLFVGLAMGM